jgi:hypothetical protein
MTSSTKYPPRVRSQTQLKIFIKRFLFLVFTPIINILVTLLYLQPLMSKMQLTHEFTHFPPKSQTHLENKIIYKFG